MLLTVVTAVILVTHETSIPVAWTFVSVLAYFAKQR